MGLKQVYKTTERHTEKNLSTIQLNVLTPAFYSRFVHYAHASEAFDRECLCTDELNRTLWVSNAELLPILLSGLSKPTLDERPEHHQLDYGTVLDRFRWAMLRKLRCSPSAPSYSANQAKDSLTFKQDIRAMPYSEFDRYVRANLEDSWIYRRSVTTLFLAQRLAFGFEGLIQGFELLLRFALVLLVWRYTSNASMISTNVFPDWTLSPTLAQGYELLLVNLVHIWACVK